MPILEAQHIQKRYRSNHVLKGVDLSIEPGTLVGVVGENGSGKSTLLSILAGELQASEGEVCRWLHRLLPAEAGCQRLTYDCRAPSLL